jgi:hypothetical protein
LEELEETEVVVEGSVSLGEGALGADGINFADAGKDNNERRIDRRERLENSVEERGWVL